MNNRSTTTIALAKAQARLSKPHTCQGCTTGTAFGPAAYCATCVAKFRRAGR